MNIDAESLNTILAIQIHLFKIHRVSVRPLISAKQSFGRAVANPSKIPTLGLHSKEPSEEFVYIPRCMMLPFNQSFLSPQGHIYYLFEVYGLSNLSPLVVMRGRDFSNSSSFPGTRNWYAITYY